MGRTFKPGIAFLLAFGLTVFLYWPIYQKIPLGNSQSSIDTEVSRLNLPLSEEVKEILDRKIDLPSDRHELCLKNKNSIFLIHADSNTPGIPFVFSTDDLSQLAYGKENNIGAMAIILNYQDTQSKDEIYRNVGDAKSCMTLDVKKLKSYASSTIEYRHVGLKSLEEFDLGDKGKIAILRSIVGVSFIDTSKSSAHIVARWNFFLLTLLVLFGLSILFVNWIAKNCQRFSPTFSEFFKKEQG